MVNLITEYGSTLDGFKTEVFSNFYKMIEPKEVFLVQVIYETLGNDDMIQSLKKTITTVIPSQIENEKVNIFAIFGLDKLSFHPNIFVLDGRKTHCIE